MGHSLTCENKCPTLASCYTVYYKILSFKIYAFSRPITHNNAGTAQQLYYQGFFPIETDRHTITLSHKVVLHYPEGDILWTKNLSYSEFALGAVDLACVK